jgi:hypothetical protein
LTQQQRNFAALFKQPPRSSPGKAGKAADLPAKATTKADQAKAAEEVVAGPSKPEGEALPLPAAAVAPVIAAAQTVDTAVMEIGTSQLGAKATSPGSGQAPPSPKSKGKRKAAGKGASKSEIEAAAAAQRQEDEDMISCSGDEEEEEDGVEDDEEEGGYPCGVVSIVWLDYLPSEHDLWPGLLIAWDPCKVVQAASSGINCFVCYTLSGKPVKRLKLRDDTVAPSKGRKGAKKGASSTVGAGVYVPSSLLYHSTLCFLPCSCPPQQVSMPL